MHWRLVSRMGSRTRDLWMCTQMVDQTTDHQGCHRSFRFKKNQIVFILKKKVPRGFKSHEPIRLLQFYSVRIPRSPGQSRHGGGDRIEKPGGIVFINRKYHIQPACYTCMYYVQGQIWIDVLVRSRWFQQPCFILFEVQIYLGSFSILYNKKLNIINISGGVTDRDVRSGK